MSVSRSFLERRTAVRAGLPVMADVEEISSCCKSNAKAQVNPVAAGETKVEVMTAGRLLESCESPLDGMC